MDLSAYYDQLYAAWKHRSTTDAEHRRRCHALRTSTYPPMVLQHSFQDKDLIAVTPHPKARMVGVHCHDFFELLYVYQGSCINYIDRQKVSMSAGDICMLNPRAAHEIHLPVPEQTRVFNILISCDIVDSAFFQLVSGDDFVLRFFLDSIQNSWHTDNYILFQNASCEQALTQLIEEYAHPQAYQSEILYSRFITLLITLVRSYQQQLCASHSDTPFQEIIQYIADHCDTVSVQSLADHFNYHPKYIPNLIRKYTNQSFSSLVMDFRLKKAASLLAHSAIPVSGIIEAVGYTNRSWFTRIFKEKYGLSPSQYRQLSQQKNRPHSV